MQTKDGFRKLQVKWTLNLMKPNCIHCAHFVARFALLVQDVGKITWFTCFMMNISNFCDVIKAL